VNVPVTLLTILKLILNVNKKILNLLNIVRKDKSDLCIVQFGKGLTGKEFDRFCQCIRLNKLPLEIVGAILDFTGPA
jgi:hypothetical protein